jgi:FemAB-related protein (PEP-CTERM system-associated)
MVIRDSMTVTAERDGADWDGFVSSRADASGYHLWRWRHVFEEAFGHATEYLAARNGDGAICGVLPLVQFDSRVFGRFMVSLPFVNYGGLLTMHSLAAERLLSRASELARARGLRHIELRHRGRLCPDLAVKTHKVGMTLALPGNEAGAWTALDRKVRNQIKKAEKCGLLAGDGGAELLTDFYGVFAHNMRDLGTPVYSRNFFAAVMRHCPDQTRVHVVRQEGKAVAAAISYAYRGTIEVPWASSLRAYRAMCPNNLLYWGVMRYAIARGFTTLDFGRSTLGEGTFHFKRQWGAEPAPLFWEYALTGRSTLPDQSPANPQFRTAIAVWKRLPVGVATWLGPHIVRSLP